MIADQQGRRCFRPTRLDTGPVIGIDGVTHVHALSCEALDDSGTEIVVLIPVGAVGRAMGEALVQRAEEMGE